MAKDENQFAELADGLKEDTKAKKLADAKIPAPDLERDDGDDGVEEMRAALAEGSPGTMDGFEDEHPGVAEIEFATEQFDPEPEEAVQALRDFTLQTIKALDQPWHKLSQQRQQDLAHAIENGCETVVRQIVEMIAARGQQPVRVLLKKVNAGDKIQITGEVSLLGSENPDDAMLLLLHAIGKHVMLTRATIEDYRQGADAETEADQPEMEFESEELSD